jgi:hypothetical protein
MQTGFKKKYLSQIRAKKLISTLPVYGKAWWVDLFLWKLTCWLHLMAGNWWGK